MPKDFENYKAFCKEHNLKECRLSNLQKYLEDNKKHKQNFNNDINITLSMTSADKLQAIEDFIIWASKQDFNLNASATFIEYKNYLLSKGVE